MTKLIKIKSCSDCPHLFHEGGMSICEKISSQIVPGGDYRKSLLPNEDDEGVHPNCPLPQLDKE